MKGLALAGAAALISAAAGAAAQGIRAWQNRRRRRRGHDATARRGTPLRRIVAACEARWFVDELKLATAGDAEAAVRVGHMLAAGYGVRRDRPEAARWLKHAWDVLNLRGPPSSAVGAAAALDVLDPAESAVPALNARGGGGSASEAERRRWRRQPLRAAAAATAAASGSGAARQLQRPSASADEAADSPLPEPPPVQALYAHLGCRPPPAASRAATTTQQAACNAAAAAKNGVAASVQAKLMG